jgi:hypothetical protein
MTATTVHVLGRAVPTWLRPRPALLTVLLSIPIVVAWIVLARDPWYPTGDMAQAELHVRGIWSHLPLVGAAGRIESDLGVQGSHPGPSLWFAMYPVYALFGRSSIGLMAGAASVSIAAIALSLWLAARRGGTVLMMAVALVLAVLIRSSGPAVFTEPWNPWLAFVPFLAFLLAVWSAVAGEHRMWALAVVLGSHCIQCHTGYIVVVLGVLGVGVLWVAMRAYRNRALLMPTARGLGGGVIAGLLMWLLPLIDQLTRSPGNAAILFQHFGRPAEAYLPRRVVAEALLNQMSLTGPWLTGPEIPWVFWPGSIGFAVLWVAALVVVWRRRDPREVQIHALLVVAAALGALSVSRIFGPYFEYTVRWLWIVAAGIVAASVASLWRAWSAARPDQAPPRRRVAAGAFLATVAVTTVATVQFGARAEIAGSGDGRLVGGLVDDVEDALSDDARYLLRWWDPAGLGGPGFGLQVELERRGMSIGVDEQFAAASLPHRVLAEDDATAVLYLVIGPQIDQVRGTPGLQEIAEFDPRSPEQQARSEELRALLVEGLVAAGRPELVDALDAQYGQARLIFAEPPLPPEIAALAGEFVGLRQPGVVFLAPPGTPVPALGIGG